MQVDKNTISKVFALFDEEDLVYIKLDREKSYYKKRVDKEKEKTLGGKNDRPRKRY